MTETTPRLVLVSDGIPNQLYLAETTLDHEAIASHMAPGKVLKLENCYMLRTLMVPRREGIAAENMVTPIGVFRGATTVYVRPVSFMYTDQDKHTDARLRELLKNCQDNEIRNRAADAGLVTASPVPHTNNPDGLRVVDR